MARINTNIPSLVAHANLGRSTSDLVMRLQRLSTGLRVNRGADDPAGLIVSERLRSEMRGLQQAIDNSERAGSVIATAEGYLAEVSDLLTSIKALVVEAANSGALSQEEIEANQLQIDSALESITRISSTASFAGLQLLNGALDYHLSGVPASAIGAVRVHGAQFGGNPTVPVEVQVIASALTASLFLSGNIAGSAGALPSSVTIEVMGNAGVQTLSFVSGTTFANVIAAINQVKATTGVSASLVNPGNATSGLTFNSVGFGSNQFVSIRRIGEGGQFWALHDAQNGNEMQRAVGRDVRAIINGAAAQGNGLRISLNVPALSVQMELSAEYAQTLGVARSFDITGGGANFQLGPSITATQQIGIGIQSIATSRLGGSELEGVRYFLDSLKSGQPNSLLTGRMANASAVLDAAISEVAVIRGRLGAFERNTLQTNMRSLQIGFENITASESKIRDADFAAETAALTRAQIMTQAGTSVLATANSLNANVLALLQ